MIDPRTDFYTTGGALKLSAPSYVVRPADEQLLRCTRAGEFCYVLTPRQMGKSSLMVRTAARLREEGIRSAIVDLTAIGSRNITAEQWYLGQIKLIAQAFGIKADWRAFWDAQAPLGAVQRFHSFFAEFVLDAIDERMVVFVDEIDSTLSLQFARDDYFATIRALYNARPLDTRLERLSFVLLGVASPSDLIKDPNRTPFNVGRRIELTDFSARDAEALCDGLTPERSDAMALLSRVLDWTSGHPYLTQKACARIGRWAREEWRQRQVPFIADELMRELFLEEPGRTADDNLQFVGRSLEGAEGTESLKLYRSIRDGVSVPDDEQDPTKVRLKLSGLVKVEDGFLHIRNRIYRTVFDSHWVSTRLTEETPAPSSEGYDVFVSYTSRDEPWVADFLVPRLQDAGLKLFLDRTSVAAGQDFVVGVERAIATSKIFLPVMSPDWAASTEKYGEASLALKLGKPITPLMLKPARTSILEKFNYIDFTNASDWDGSMNQLLAALIVRGEGEKSSLRRSLSSWVRRAARAVEKPSAPPSNRSALGRSGSVDRRALRNLLDDALPTDDDVTAFTFDYFPDAHQRVTAAGSRGSRIQALLEQVIHDNGVDELLDRIAKVAPRQYRIYQDAARSRDLP